MIKLSISAKLLPENDNCSVSLQSYSKSHSVIAAMCCRYLYQNQDLSPGTTQTGDPPVSDKRQSRVQWLHLLSVFRIIVIVIVIALVASIVNHSYHRPSKKSFVQACATICDQDFAQIALMISRLYCPLSAMLLHKYSTCVDSAFFERTFLEDFGQFTDNSMQKVLLHQLDHPVM